MIPEFTLLITAILAVCMIFLSMKSGQRVYNLVASGLFLHLAITLSEHTALLVVFVALILWQIYWAFLSKA